jgi:hypothetical protein
MYFIPIHHLSHKLEPKGPKGVLFRDFKQQEKWGGGSDNAPLLLLPENKRDCPKQQGRKGELLPPENWRDCQKLQGHKKENSR